MYCNSIAPIQSRFLICRLLFLHLLGVTYFLFPLICRLFTSLIVKKRVVPASLTDKACECPGSRTNRISLIKSQSLAESCHIKLTDCLPACLPIDCCTTQPARSLSRVLSFFLSFFCSPFRSLLNVHTLQVTSTSTSFTTTSHWRLLPNLHFTVLYCCCSFEDNPASQ